MPDISDRQRENIHEAIQRNAPIGSGALLVGWAVVAEWVDHEGDRWLSKAHSASTTSWTVKGMHHEALYGKWPGSEEDES